MVIRHNCGFCVAHTLHDVYSFIKSLQHRGREAAGIACIGETIDVIKWAGDVNRFSITDLYKIFPSEKYHTYLAHVRYATKGRKDRILHDAHPQVIGGEVKNRGEHTLILNCDAVMVHNGQVEEKYLKEVQKAKLKTDCDTEALLHIFYDKGEDYILKNIPGSYTLATAKKGGNVIVLRDQSALKPGSLGWKDGKFMVASEDVAFLKNGGIFIEDLMPGYAYNIKSGGDYEKKKVVSERKKHCFFEWNYISHLESTINSITVRRVREKLGEKLAKEFPFKVDFVTFLPRCPEVAARKYAEILGLNFIQVFYKTKDERSFLGSSEKERKISISSNLYLLPKVDGAYTKDLLKGKTIAIIDDSTIRGNNSKKAIELLKEETEVKEILLLNYTPKIGIIPQDGIPRGCLYGVDMPPTDNFISRNNSSEEINRQIGAKTFFMSKEVMESAFEELGINKSNLCTFCIGGEKPF